MRLYRLIAILLLIESRGQIKAKELASALETSVRTIYRDIEILCQAGIPIAAATGPNGGICFMEGYSAKLYNLQGDDAVNLYLSGVALYDEDTHLNLRNALLKLEAILPPEYGKDVKIARERFYFDKNPWWGEHSNAQCIENLRKSVWASKKLLVEYRKVNGGTSERELLPYGLVVKCMQWYLVAFCLKSKTIKTFKCDRIIKAELKDEKFEMPEDFSLERYWKENEKSFKAACMENEKYPVQIKLLKSDSSILNKFDVYDVKEIDDYLVAKVNMHKYEFACTEAMEIAWNSEILSPIELRNFIRRKLFNAVGMYSNN